MASKMESKKSASATSKAAKVSSTLSLRDTEELTAAQLNELSSLLKQQRSELAEKIKLKRNNAATADQGTGDEVDQATQSEENLLEIELMERDVMLLIEIDAALQRIEEGTYGICEGTDEPIGYLRLKHKPWARYSITYQEELERNAKRSYNNSRG